MPTIGVSVAIPEPWGTRLQDYRTSLGDATAHTIPTHITLIPPTEVDEEALPQVVAHLDEVAARHGSFRVRLRGTGTFRPVSPVVFVQVAEGIPGCERLQADLRRGPLAVGLEFPYHPHVTVAHHLDDEALDRAFAELASFECSFEVDDFLLYVHEEVRGWVPRQAFGLS